MRILGSSCSCRTGLCHPPVDDPPVPPRVGTQLHQFVTGVVAQAGRSTSISGSSARSATGSPGSTVRIARATSGTGTGTRCPARRRSSRCDRAHRTKGRRPLGEARGGDLDVAWVKNGARSTARPSPSTAPRGRWPPAPARPCRRPAAQPGQAATPRAASASTSVSPRPIGLTPRRDREPAVARPVEPDVWHREKPVDERRRCVMWAARP